ncbi:MAG: phosphoribosylglycinamide formyltransferase [Bdellovibrionaceae bacterium]|nr:phosphoribosylglycinamide formyltransferase [Bdellovibrio sp.]
MSVGFRKPVRVAVFISGGGSTLQALLEMHHQFEIALVVSNRKNAPGLLKARRFGKPIFVQAKDFSFDELTKKLKSFGIERIILAGYMKIVPANFVEQWKFKILNIHPSLLPNLPGLNAAERSYAAGGPMGVSIHFVTAEMDAGPLFLQQTSLADARSLSIGEAEIFLRRTEQHLLREMVLRSVA